MCVRAAQQELCECFDEIMDGKIGDRKAEIYTYESDNVVYGLSWSVSHTP